MPSSSGSKNPFSSGLGKGGRIGAWVVAIGIVAAWNYYDSRSFSSEEQESWNAEKKKKAASSLEDQKK